MEELGAGTSMEGDGGRTNVPARALPPVVASLLASADGDEREWAWQDFLAAYGSVIDTTVRHAVARYADDATEVRVHDSTRWLLRQLRARDLHLLRGYAGARSFTTYLVGSTSRLVRAGLSTSRSNTGGPDDPEPEDGSAGAILPRRPSPAAGGRNRHPDDVVIA